MTNAHYLRYSAAGTAFLLALIASVNVSVDPAGLFGGDAFERRLAKTLLAGKSEKISRNFNERLLHRFYVQGLAAAPEAMMLGSSRVLDVGQASFPGNIFFNAGVSGATLEDLLALFHLYSAKGLPRLVILGLDPWMLNRNNGQTRWQTLRAEYEIARQELMKTSSVGRLAGGPPSVWGELISLAYFQESLRLLTGFKRPDEIMEWIPEKMSDGRYDYGWETRSRTVEQVRNRAIKYASGTPIYALGDFHELDSEYSVLFEAFLRKLRKKGVRVVVMLAPYHPEVYRVMVSAEAYRNVRAAEEYFRRAAAAAGVELVGSYDSAAAGCLETEFYDGMHPKASCLDKILSGAGDGRA